MLLWLLIAATLLVGDCNSKKPIPSFKHHERVFVLVLDGVVHDYDKLNISMPHLKYIAHHGVKVDRLVPPFPSDTWPSMTTLMTGVYPETHGIISNHFVDWKDASQRRREFNYKDDPLNYENNGRFFRQEPVWLTNQKQGGRSAVYYMPGYYADRVEKPFYHNVPVVDDGVTIEAGVQAIDNTTQLLYEDPHLNLVIVWVDQPDHMGHLHGPSSTEYKENLKRVDKEIIGYLMEKLKSLPKVNLIVTADHGFIDVHNKQNLTDYLTNGTFYVSNSGGSCLIQPLANLSTVDEIMANLTQLNNTGHYKVYRKSEFPEHLHYTADSNIPSVLILADVGWGIAYDGHSHFKGAHGYDNQFPGISTILYGLGPMFKPLRRIKSTESVNVYPLICHLIGITPLPNNGTSDVFYDVLNHYTSHDVNAAIIIVCVVVLLVVSGLVVNRLVPSDAVGKAQLRRVLSKDAIPLMGNEETSDEEGTVFELSPM